MPAPHPRSRSLVKPRTPPTRRCQGREGVARFRVVYHDGLSGLGCPEGLLTDHGWWGGVPVAGFRCCWSTRYAGTGGTFPPPGAGVSVDDDARTARTVIPRFAVISGARIAAVADGRPGGQPFGPML